jgi:hypothetical protein
MSAIPWREMSQRAPMSADVALRPQVIEGEAEVVRSVLRVRRSAWEWYGDVVHVSVPAVWWYLFAAIILGMFTRPWGFLGPVVLAGYLILSAACVLVWKVSRRREGAFLEWVAEKEALSVDGQRTDRAMPPPDSRSRHQLGAVGKQTSRNAVGLREVKTSAARITGQRQRHRLPDTWTGTSRVMIAGTVRHT